MLIHAFRRALSRPHGADTTFASSLLFRAPLSTRLISKRNDVSGTRLLHATAIWKRSVHSPEAVNVEHSEWLSDSAGFGKEAKAGDKLDSDDLEQIAEGKGASVTLLIEGREIDECLSRKTLANILSFVQAHPAVRKAHRRVGHGKEDY